MKTKYFFLFATLFFCILFSGCMSIQSFDTVIELKPSESWGVTITTTFDKASAQQYSSTISQNLTTTVNNLASKGVKANWKEGNETSQGTIPFILTLNGEGIDNLNNLMFSGSGITKTQVNGENHFDISIPSSTFNVQANEISITLIGGKILSTNGKIVNSTTVKWENPQEDLTATMDEPEEGFPWGTIVTIIVIGVIGLIAAVGTFLFILLKRPKSVAPINVPISYSLPHNPPTPTLTGTLAGTIEPKFCPKCGAPLKPGARFCTNCGYKS